MTLEINPVVRRAYEAANQVVSAHCDLLYQCDLDCEHCYLDDKKLHILPTAFWKDVFDQLADLGVLVLLISGGEAFLRKDLFELLDHAKAQGLLVALNTHGGWLTESSAQRLRQTSVFQVQLSYYSH